VNYATYGPKSPFTNIIKNDELKKMKGETLTNKIKELQKYKHKVLYYGTLNPEQLKQMLEKTHGAPSTFIDPPKDNPFVELATDKNRVAFSHYEANQSFLQMISKSVDYNFDILPQSRIYNAYFGGGMNTIVFQELREKRGLAYTARSFYATPSNPKGSFMNNSYIATQNDKVIEAFTAFNELFDDMPVSVTSFELAKESIISGIRNERITKMNVIWNYISAQEMGYKEDIRKTYFETIPTMTMDDVVRFNEQYVKNKPKTYVILGNEKAVDFKQIQKKFGPVTKLNRDEIFGH
jgi:predicted Zn-dependent peptidase